MALQLRQQLQWSTHKEGLMKTTLILIGSHLLALAAGFAFAKLAKGKDAVKVGTAIQNAADKTQKVASDLKK